MNKKASSRENQQPSRSNRLQAYFLDHPRVLLFSLGKLYRAPLASLMTISVIAIALALPTALYLLLLNVQLVSSGWDGNPRISLYLIDNLHADKAEKLVNNLSKHNNISAVSYLSPEEALQEFRNISGFGEVLDALDENPLPGVVIVTPNPKLKQAEGLLALAEELGKYKEVEQAQLDVQWVKRLYTILELIGRGVWILAGLLALAVLLTVGNTIRLDILNRKEEIEVTKLIGATNSFIRRPFLYGGFWYGALGSLMALLLVSAALAMLYEPVRVLATLYSSDYQLLSIDLQTASLVLLCGSLLGWAGSWVAVSRHINKIEPK